MDFIDLKTQYKRHQQQIDARIHAVLNHGQYIMGPEIRELEEQLAAFVGVKHCISVANGTDALLIAMMALGIKAGDEIITTPFTFIATGEMIALLGAVPVFVDIEPNTFNIDPAKIEAAITPKTKGIMPVSLYGQCADMTAINAIATRHNLPVIEDAAQSFGAMHHGKRSCGISTIGCTSFFPSKPLGCYGDGGACFTDDDALATTMRQLRVHGQDRRYHHPIIGLNGRLDTIQAAILIPKLEIFPEEIVAREKVAAWYHTALARHNIASPYLAPGNTSVYAQYTIQVDRRDQFCETMKSLGIPTAVHYPIPLHLQPAFAHLNQGRGSYPVSEKIAARVVSLPMHPYLEAHDVDKIVNAINEAIGQTATA
jgi:UDP-2-acetamido-2-deoxy-ribo-hexuluronate aminotransferase